MNVKVDEVRPRSEPLVKYAAVIALHDLIAASEVIRYPTAHVVETFRSEPPAKPEAGVNRARITTAKVLDDHEEHRAVEKAKPAH